MTQILLLIHSVIGWFVCVVAKSVCAGMRWLRPAAFDCGKNLPLTLQVYNQCRLLKTNSNYGTRTKK